MSTQRKHIAALLALALLAATGSAALAQTKKDAEKKKTKEGSASKLFDPAPPLEVDEWVKGKPINLSEGVGKSVYIVEFWATWCGPCRVSIPHLTETQHNYKDKGVVIIGVSVDGDETVKSVKGFVKDMGAKMDYNVCIDNDGATNKAYMKAFKIPGIPHAFIIDKKGRIAWDGHPSFPEGRMEKVLDKVIAGDWDQEAAEAEAREAKKAEQKAIKDMQAKAMAMMKVRANCLNAMKSGEKDKLTEAGEKILKDYGDDAQMLNDVAWTMLANKNCKVRDKKLALRMAKAAYDASEGKEAAIVDTYARALYDNDQKDEAVKIEEAALKLAKDMKGPQARQLVKDLQETLEIYKDGKPAKMEDNPIQIGPGGDDDEDDDSAADTKKKKSGKDDDDDD